MIDLAAIRNMALFHLHKIADADVFLKPRLRANPGKWTDATTGSDNSRVDSGMRKNFCAGGDLGILYQCERPDTYAVAKFDFAFEDCVNVDENIAST